MDKKSKLKLALQKFTGTDDKTLEAFQTFSASVSKLESDLKEKMQVATLSKVNGELDNFSKKIDFQPILKALNTIKEEFKNETDTLSAQMETKVSEMIKSAELKENENTQTHSDQADDLSLIREEIASVIAQKNADLANLRKECMDMDIVSDEKVSREIKTLDTRVGKAEENITINKEETTVSLDTLTKAIPALKTELLQKLGGRGGGSMNRKETFGGVDYLTRYTDINWKAGTNVTFTVTNNNQTKMVDVTITATGGSGGTVRSINSISSPQTAGATAGTDYVYLISGTTQITMPTAVGNKNLYTLKNVGTGIVTIVFTGIETCDGQTTITMPVQYTSIDIISDTVNWNIT